MNYKKELAKLKATEADLRKNKRLSEMAQAIDDLLESTGVIERRIKAGDGNVEVMQNDLAEVKNEIKELDEKLTAEIPTWLQKKADFVKKMQDAQAKKYSTAATTPAPAPARTPSSTPAAPVATAPVVDTEKKKGNGGAFILFGVLALVVTVGAVNLFKKQ